MMLTKDNLHDYQKRAVEFIVRKKRCALFLDMGLGKTITALTAASELLDDMYVSRVLIIAPLRVANTVWYQELKNWMHMKDYKCIVCTGNEYTRLKKLKSDADFYVINRENVVWLEKQMPWKWDMVIIDESSSFKNSRSMRFKAMRRNLKYTKSLVCLTGTPSPNSMMDLWSQIFLIDFGARLAKAITHFKQRFFYTIGFKGYKFGLKEGADEEIKNLLKDICMTMKAEDYLELPEVIYLNEYVHLSQKDMDQYKEMEKEFIMTLSEGVDIQSPSAAGLANKLLQMCNGAVYDEEKNTHELHRYKLDCIKDIIDDNPNENFLIAYNYKSDLVRLQKEFPNAVVLSKEGKEVKDWNDGKIKIMLAHPACLHPDTEVLTEYRGWVRIVDVREYERVFDGVEFVHHSGCRFSGVKKVINKFGITLTPNHKLLINDKWIKAKDVQNNKDTREEARYTYEGDDSYLSSMLPLWGESGDSSPECGKSKSEKEGILRSLYKRYLPSYDRDEDTPNMDGNVGKNLGQKQPKLPKLWWKGYNCLQRMVRVQEFLFGYVGRLSRTFDNRENRQRSRLFKRELPMGDMGGASLKQKEQQVHNGQNTSCGVLSYQQCEQGCNNTETEQRDDTRGSSAGLRGFNIPEEKEVSEVYDLVDCGPRNRFLIRNAEGEVFISHNSAGHGLNLQYGGSCIIWFGLNWSLELYQQFNARLNRQGQTKPVRIIHIVAKGCIDERVLKALESKAESQDKLMEQLKHTF